MIRALAIGGSAAADRPPTVGRLRRGIAAELRAAWGEGDPDRTPALDARMILAHALGVEAGALIRHEDDPVPAEVAAAVGALVARRIGGEPVARIIGEKPFWSLSFRLSAGTLEPRPDSETLVAATLEALAAKGRTNAPLAILDLGTGTGCILLALLSELPLAFGFGIDRDAGAARTAAENAGRLGLGHRCAFAVGDWLGAIAGRFDVIVANPPYIPAGSLRDLPVEVRRFDPVLALAGGGDGLSAYRAIIPALPRVLSSEGLAVLEFGPDQADAIGGFGAAAGLTTTLRRDLGGRDRAAVLCRAG